MASCESRFLKAKVISWPFYSSGDHWGSPLGSPHPGRLQCPPEGKRLILSSTGNSSSDSTKTPHSPLATSNSLVVATYTFSFHSRDKHNWWPRLMPLRHQPGKLISKLPEENSWGRSGRPGKKVNSLHFPWFQSFYFTSKLIEFPILNGAISLSELMEDMDLDTFLKEDQATLAKRGRESMARIVWGASGLPPMWVWRGRNCSPTMSIVTLCSRYIQYISIPFYPFKP